MLIDTHAHLYWEDYKKDLDEVIQRSIDAGVTTIINVGVDVEKSKTAAQLQSDNIKFYSTIGIHPHEAVKYSQLRQTSSDRGTFVQRDIERLEQIYKSNSDKVIAIGECGLDYFFDPEFTPSTLSVDEIKQLQRQLFQAQIDLAKKLNLPLIVHCRDDRSKGSGSTGPSILKSSGLKGSPPQETSSPSAWDEVLKIIGIHPAILHCYSGLSPTTNYILRTTNLLVSFAGTVTYPKNDYLREAAKILPLEKIVLETDCPFLPPQSKRGQRNEPANVLEIAQIVADLKSISLDEVAHQTTKNVKIMFNLK